MSGKNDVCDRDFDYVYGGDYDDNGFDSTDVDGN